MACKKSVNFEVRSGLPVATFRHQRVSIFAGNTFVEKSRFGPISHIPRGLRFVTKITIPGDECHRPALRSLLSLARGWALRIIQGGGKFIWLRQMVTGSIPIQFQRQVQLR
jgi:hypothetical protein